MTNKDKVLFFLRRHLRSVEVETNMIARSGMSYTKRLEMVATDTTERKEESDALRDAILFIESHYQD